ncbi:hypothetical protein N7466_003370 [Penicillium verhagenii]|uniref:uncharacterized protein n=1 Tax=Penicillium verhagenii TaxID=1562060 RepID=UPI0025457A56|nr:uncharacterized protein N7466_003370 [Penicillium verhagenii]KAJ5936920.1 hypothetical protein N7466_003370 [Penicillium verhagenii]
MESDGEDDYVLKAAIEASLRESKEGASSSSTSPEKQSKPVVDLTCESESEVEVVFPKSNSTIGSETDDEAERGLDGADEEMRRAIAMSLQDSPSIDTPEMDVEPAATEVPPESTLAKSSAPSLGFLGLNRKQMEEERLARMKKRKPEDSGSPPPAKLYKTESSSTKPVLQSFSSSVSSSQASSEASPSPVRPTARPIIQWPLGTVKKTHVMGSMRENKEILIEEVIQRGDLELGVFSSFLWDMEWFFTKCDTWSTRFLLIMHAKEQELRDTMVKDVEHMKNIRLCFPPMDGQISTMHSKLMLLFHPGYLRIVVPTANLTRADWGEDRLMENTVFLIDLPRKVAFSHESPKTFFYQELVYFLKASTLNEHIIAKLDEFDFTETARYAFIHTIGGSSPRGPEELWRHTGYCGLGRAVNYLGLRSPSPINVDYVASSIGSLNNEFLRAIYLACKGDDGLADYTLRYEKSSARQSNPEQQIMMKAGEEWQSRFNVYFPSNTTVHAAHAFPQDTGGTVCFQAKWWSGAKFPRQVMKDCVSERSVLMHNKVRDNLPQHSLINSKLKGLVTSADEIEFKLMYVWPSKPIELPNNRQCKGWAYVGSANMSESAWGRLVKDRETKQPKLNCRNWECGVLVPVISPATASTQDANITDSQPKYLPAEIFAGTVPIPMVLPARPLSENNKPWFFMGDK